MTPATLADTSPRLVRRLVLGTALLLALIVALGPRTPAVHAQPSAPPAPAAAPGPSKATEDAAAPKEKGTSRSATINIKTDDHTVTIDATAPARPDTQATDDEDAEPAGPVVGVGKGKHKRVRVGGFGSDREFDSFNDFIHSEPEFAGMVIAIVAIVFLSPVIVLALILWYRMRKNRMLNETMLKLAEKGVVPPVEALGALAGSPNGALAAAPSASPIYEQAKQIRRRAAWSDLRKGVILGGIGLGLAFYSMLDDGSPNGLGLVLLFVGIGYIVLWWFEDRQFPSKGSGAGAAPAVPSSGGMDGKA
jgi:hypothetical protein